MLDFMNIQVKLGKNGTVIKPIFNITTRSKDILVKGKSLYGIWDEDRNEWSTVIEDAARIIDKNIEQFAKDYITKHPNESVNVEYLRDDTNGAALRFMNFIKNKTDCKQTFNNKIIFADQEIKKEDYCTVKAKYAVVDGNRDNYEKLISTLYAPEERHKLEWLMGAVIAGANLDVQKFGVMYGPPGSGKSTMIEIIAELFDGYYVTFNSREIAKGDSFALSSFKKNPLVAVDAEGDLSKIESNSTLNTLTAHDIIKVNEKYQAKFDLRPLAIIFICTNNPVKITDSKSGLLRRLIDINPSGNKVPLREYRKLMKAIPFELGAIAYHCREVYLKDPDYYDGYRPTEMFEETNDFYDFLLTYYNEFASEEYTTLKAAWGRYKEYIELCEYSYKMNMNLFKNELRNYFSSFNSNYKFTNSDGERIHITNVYSGFKKSLFKSSRDTVGNNNSVKDEEEIANKDIYEGMPDWLHLKDSTEFGTNAFNKMFNDARAQYATTGGNEVPKRSWNNDDGSFSVKTKLSDILLSSQVHYVLTQEVEPSMIVIDFDKKDKDGKKNLRLNLEAASTFPKTYAEVSKGGQGLHLHYIYDGDVNDLSMIYDDDVEVKVYRGLSALRRRLSLCNGEEIAHINSGLPLKGVRGDKMIDTEAVLNEKAIRTVIRRNLNKEYHADTTSSMHFIKKTLEDAFASGKTYDVRDLRNAITNFAMRASNQSQHCMEIAVNLPYCSKDILDGEVQESDEDREEGKRQDSEKPIVFFDIEMFPNLFVVCYKKQGPGGKEACVKLINPSGHDIENLVNNSRLIGFNNLNYDNVIMWAAILGKTIPELYQLSCDIIAGSKNVNTGKSKDVSYADVYDFSNTKMSLKKWEIELDIHHQELGLRWDKPVPKELWEKVADYCCNDVVATEKVFDHLKEDWNARQILASLSGLTVNDTTNRHSGRIIFGNNKHPQNEFIYTDLSKEFAGYEFCKTGIDKDRYIRDEEGKPIFAKGFSIYMGEDPSEGGYVYAEPGIHEDVALLDIASLHPTTIEVLQVFGERYTKRFSEIKRARVAVKHKAWDEARSLLNGALKPFIAGVENLSAEEQQDISDGLAYALKIVINSIYGLTSAKFENLFKDPRNIDNIVAKRGALFMITLKHEVQKMGYRVAHVKTDSIKIPNADDKIISFVMEFGKKYGYTFEHEATYKKMCLVNDAVYIAKYDEFGERTKGGRHANAWTATGAQFQIPYVFKTLFSHDPIEFKDICETKSVGGNGNIYLDFDENMIEKRSEYEKELSIFEKQHAVPVMNESGKKVKKFIAEELGPDETEEFKKLNDKIGKLHNYVFVGRVGQFCPMKAGCGGGILLIEADENYTSVTGSKGYRWLESEVVRSNGMEKDVDRSYYGELVDKAYETISKYGDADEFIYG